MSDDTTDQQALRAVLALPDDDAPRLAYATLMDKTDPPRGEFIRVQIERASAKGTARVLAGIDEKVLLMEHGRRWAAPLAGRADDHRFHCGFIEELNLSAAAFLQHGALLRQLMPVRHLTLTAVRPLWRALLDSPLLVPTRSLALDRNGLDDDDIAALAATPMLPDLRWLSLASNDIDLRGVEAMAGSTTLPQLRWCNFAGNPVDPGEQPVVDQGYIVDTWMPDAGLALEQRHGPLRWLHLSAQQMRDDTLDRFSKAWLQ
jgi:uncharacterized protein (TIGR02996 family)